MATVLPDQGFVLCVSAVNQFSAPMGFYLVVLSARERCAFWGRGCVREDGGATHPEVSDDEGQHVAPLPIVLPSCQAPGSR